MIFQSENKKISLFRMDAMKLMAPLPDQYYDLALVDPIYGVQENAYRNNDKDNLAKKRNYHAALWDQKKTGPEYFKELLRVSKHQIIWGGNYFISNLYDTRCMLVWDKQNSGNFADAELAWTSFDSSVRIFKYRWNGMLQQDMKNKEERIHPCHKPIALYKWLLKNYAEPGFKVLDTHLGGGSSAIAAHYFGCEFTGCEIEQQYFQDAVDRFKLVTSQTAMPFDAD